MMKHGMMMRRWLLGLGRVSVLLLVVVVVESIGSQQWTTMKGTNLVSGVSAAFVPPRPHQRQGRPHQQQPQRLELPLVGGGGVDACRVLSLLMLAESDNDAIVQHNNDNDNDNNNNNNGNSQPKLNATTTALTTSTTTTGTEPNSQPFQQLDPSTRSVVEAAAARRRRVVATAGNNSDNNNKSHTETATAAGDITTTTTTYPIHLPSPVLLATSMVVAIVSTGCLFELVGTGESRDLLPLGFAMTAAIVVIGTPMAIFLFYAAIAKATAETEEDDQAFLSGK